MTHYDLRNRTTSAMPESDRLIALALIMGAMKAHQKGVRMKTTLESIEETLFGVSREEKRV